MYSRLHFFRFLTNTTTPPNSTDEYAVEFDCAVNLLGLSYCYHVFTRTGTYTPDLLLYVQSLALKMGLNPSNLKWDVTPQGTDKCGKAGL